MNPEQIQRTYADLAERYHRQGLPRQRDWLLILAADTAQTAGQHGEADRLLADLVRLSPDHFLTPFGSFAEAVCSPDVQAYLGKLRRTYPTAKAAELLGAGQGREPVEFVTEAAPQETLPPRRTAPLQSMPTAGKGQAPATEDPAGDVAHPNRGHTAAPAPSEPAPAVTGLAGAAELADVPAGIPPGVPTLEAESDKHDGEEVIAEVSAGRTPGGTAAADVADEPAEFEELIEITEAVEDDTPAALGEPAPALDQPDEVVLAEEAPAEDPGSKPAPPASPPPASKVPGVLRWLFRRRRE
jgi:hypothetical protein